VTIKGDEIKVTNNGDEQQTLVPAVYCIAQRNPSPVSRHPHLVTRISPPSRARMQWLTTP